MTWNDMKWHEMTWNDMKWHEMTWNDMKWHEMTWNDMKWHEMTWNDMKWHEIESKDMIEQVTSALSYPFPQPSLNHLVAVLPVERPSKLTSQMGSPNWVLDLVGKLLVNHWLPIGYPLMNHWLTIVNYDFFKRSQHVGIPFSCTDRSLFTGSKKWLKPQRFFFQGRWSSAFRHRSPSGLENADNQSQSIIPDLKTVHLEILESLRVTVSS